MSQLVRVYQITARLTYSLDGELAHPIGVIVCIDEAISRVASGQPIVGILAGEDLLVGVLYIACLGVVKWRHGDAVGLRRNIRGSSRRCQQQRCRKGQTTVIEHDAEGLSEE